MCSCNTLYCYTPIENLSDPIGYLLDFTNPCYTVLVGNMTARAKKDNSFWSHTYSRRVASYSDADIEAILNHLLFFLLKLLSCLLNMLKN